MDRREIIKKLMAGTGVLVVLPAVMSSCDDGSSDIQPDPDPNPGPGNGSGDKLTIDLNNASYSGLKSSGGSVIVQNIIIANTGAGFVALSSICTHQGCTVGYDAVGNNFPCPCHGSLFSATGSVMNGPASTPLKSYPVSRTGDTLTIG